jgi:hypothetical protein
MNSTTPRPSEVTGAAGFREKAIKIAAVQLIGCEWRALNAEMQAGGRGFDEDELRRTGVRRTHFQRADVAAVAAGGIS